MKKPKFKPSNLIFLIIIALLIIPQTRKPIQVILHKGLALFSPSIESESNRTGISFTDWQLQDLEGNTINFKDLENKVIFLNFWATWCPPCIAEMKSIDELSNQYKDKIEFILVSSEDIQLVRGFMNKKGYDLNSYLPLTSYPDNFKIRSIPRTFLISKNGEIIIDKGGAANWNSETVRRKIDELIAQ